MGEHIAIVGGGIAGLGLCERLLERDPDARITLICGESRLPYDRVRLSELLAAEDAADTLELRPAEWFADHGVEVLLGTSVTALDAPAATLALGTAGARSFDRVALATGSTPLIPPVPGLDAPEVVAFRGPEDADRIRAEAGPGRRVAVIGGGLLGLEAARGALARGAEVTVVHLMDRLMERQLDAGAARALLPAVEALGVSVLLARATVAFADGALQFASGDPLPADLVVVAAGIRPNVELARAAGLDVERGIVVDDALRTSAPGVVAVGECAQHRGVVHGLVAPILEQCRVAAATLTEAQDAYEGSVPWARLKVAGVDLVSIGEPEGDSAAVTADRVNRTHRRIVIRDGRVCGAVLLGDTRGTEDLLAAVREREPVDDPLARLADSAAATAADLADSAQVCDCNGVCKGEIAAAVRTGGCATAREVMALTRAGTGCGSCRGLVKEIVVAEAGTEADEPAFLCPCLRQTREEIAGAIREQGLRAVSDVTAACGTGRECGACKPALAYLVSEIALNDHREERSARFINDRVHANIQNDGTFSVVPRMYAGVTTPDQLRRIADAAERYGARMVKVTGGQRIDLLGVRKEDLPDIWRDLDMPSGYAYSKAVRTVKSCVGTDFCRFGVGDSIGLAQRLEHAWEGLHTPHKVKAGVSGCPRNCAEATVKDIGVVAVEGGWQIRVGGAAGANVREADVLATVETADDVLRVGTAFLQLYRENAPFKERIYDFVPRFGLERIREIVLDDERGAALRERFAVAKAATRDPWLERDEPYHPRQFADLDGEPIVGAPAGAER